jgi:hypothetical protein
MSETTLSPQDKILLQAFEQAWAAYQSSRTSLYEITANSIGLAEYLLETNPKALSTWVYIERLKAEELKLIFDRLLSSACQTSNLIAFAIPILLRLPKQWLLENLDKHIEPFIAKYQSEAYIAIIEIYKRLDLGKALEWTKRASADADPHIKQVGEDFMAQFRKVNPSL